MLTITGTFKKERISELNFCKKFEKFQDRETRWVYGMEAASLKLSEKTWKLKDVITIELPNYPEKT